VKKDVPMPTKRPSVLAANGIPSEKDSYYRNLAGADDKAGLDFAFGKKNELSEKLTKEKR